MDSLARYDVAQKANCFLIKMILFQIVKQALFLEFCKNLPDGFHVTLVGIFDVN